MVKIKCMLSRVDVSTSRKLLSDEELLELLKVSCENNTARDITGLLLDKGGNFMQVLEGPDDQVKKHYEIIKADLRHQDVNVLSREQISTRQFSAGEMTFHNLDNPLSKTNQATDNSGTLNSSRLWIVKIPCGLTSCC